MNLGGERGSIRNVYKIYFAFVSSDDAVYLIFLLFGSFLIRSKIPHREVVAFIKMDVGYCNGCRDLFPVGYYFEQVGVQ